jgi:Ser/Thr protein kinase RdoA (MazF antagonist)
VDDALQTQHDIEAAAGVYGLGDVVAPARVAARGQQGVLWRLETTRGTFAVKHLLDPLTENDVAADVTLQTQMAARGVLLPEPLRTRDGAVLALVGSTLVRVARWVELAAPRTDLDPEEVGALLGTLHRNPLHARVPVPVDPWYTEPVPRDEWDDVARRLSAAGAPFADQFARAVPWFVALQNLFTPPATLQLCHRDLWADNVRIAGDRLCVIDWDNCGPADPAHEVAVVLTEYCYDAPDRAGLLYAAYRRAGGTARPQVAGDFTMVLAQFGHFAVTAGQDWLEAHGAADDDAAARAQTWFQEAVERPLDPDRIDLLLAAVAKV